MRNGSDLIVNFRVLLDNYTALLNQRCEYRRAG